MISAGLEVGEAGETTERTYVGESAVVTRHDGGDREVRYRHVDRLGSLETVTDEAGTEVDGDGHGYDAFGKPRPYDWQSGDERLDGVTTRMGFTQHEHLDEHRLIHMNGRVYDYRLGRFLSVDPIISNSENSQSHNPYSYILNNPLSGTDPSGYAPEPATGDNTNEANLSGLPGHPAEFWGKEFPDVGTSPLQVIWYHNPINDMIEEVYALLKDTDRTSSSNSTAGGNGADAQSTNGDASRIADRNAPDYAPYSPSFPRLHVDKDVTGKQRTAAEALDNDLAAISKRLNASKSKNPLIGMLRGFYAKQHFYYHQNTEYVASRAGPVRAYAGTPVGYGVVGEHMVISVSRGTHFWGVTLDDLGKDPVTSLGYHVVYKSMGEVAIHEVAHNFRVYDSPRTYGAFRSEFERRNEGLADDVVEAWRSGY